MTSSTLGHGHERLTQEEHAEHAKDTRQSQRNKRIRKTLRRDDLEMRDQEDLSGVISAR